MRRRALLAAFLLAACGDDASPAGSPDAAPPGPPDLSAVEPEFAPSGTPLREMVGFAYGLPSGGDPASAAMRDFGLAALEAEGIRWIRQDFLWHVVEPVQGTFDFGLYDALVDRAAADGVGFVPILQYGNPWAAPAGSDPDEFHVPPEDPADFAAYAGAAAARFAGRVGAYEIWNEPNLGFRFWQPHEDPVAYGELLVQSAAAIRQADPTAQVVLGGLIYHPVLSPGAEVFLEDMYYYHWERLAASFDVFAFHPYTLYPPRVPPEVDDPVTGEVAAARMVARLRAVMAHYGDPGKPIWVTEVGWATLPDEVGGLPLPDEELQARWMVRSLLGLAGAGVERWFWFTLNDGPFYASYPPEDAFGLWRYDDPSDGFAPEPKPGWIALTALLQLAGDLAVAEDATAELAGAPADARAYRLVAPGGAGGRRVTAVWRIDDDAPPATVTVPVDPGRALSVFDLYGAPLAAGAIVPLSGAPVYVVED